MSTIGPAADAVVVRAREPEPQPARAAPTGRRWPRSCYSTQSVRIRRPNAMLPEAGGRLWRRPGPPRGHHYSHE
jgi:hypothetical protein